MEVISLRIGLPGLELGEKKEGWQIPIDRENLVSLNLFLYTTENSSIKRKYWWS